MLRKYKNISFQKGSIDSILGRNHFDAITINDVLYLLPLKEKDKMIKKSYLLLKKGGRIYIKYNCRQLTLRFFLTYFQEYLTVKIFGLIHNDFGKLYFESTSDLRNLLQKHNFRIAKELRLPTPFPFYQTHDLIVGIK